MKKSIKLPEESKLIPNIAMVFAAGFGKRLLPITKNCPKPLVKVGNKTLLDRALDKLSQIGVDNAVVNTHYLAEQIHHHIEKRTNKTPKINISYEKEILETGGGIVNALPLLGEKPFFTINSDITWIDQEIPALERLRSKWSPDIMDALLLLQPVEKAIGYEGTGDFNIEDNGQLILKNESPKAYVFAGVMIIKPELFSDMDVHPFSIFRDALFKTNLQESGLLNRMFGLVHDGDWLHVGSPDGLEKANQYFSKHITK